VRDNVLAIIVGIFLMAMGGLVVFQIIFEYNHICVVSHKEDVWVTNWFPMTINGHVQMMPMGGHYEIQDVCDRWEPR
jgi:hypothetical protein